jgi:hypothetical protein
MAAIIPGVPDPAQLAQSLSLIQSGTALQAMAAPLAGAGAIANTPPTPAPKPTPPTKPLPGKKPQADKLSANSPGTPPKGAVRGQIPGMNHKSPSPIQKQHRDSRGQPDYVPIKITFLSGDFKGQQVDLGLGAEEVSHSDPRGWKSQEGTSLRPGLNFESIGNREISFGVTFFDLNNDISHLVENLKHLGEITGADTAPPRLLLVQGDLRAVEVVCTNFQDKYSEPLPGSLKGFRKATVDLSFKLIGGNNNANAKGSPLTSTPLADWAARTTLQERQKGATKGLIENTIAPCLKEKAVELQQLVDNNKQGDVEAIAQLSPEVFVQSAIAGVFSSDLLKSERLQVKLRDSLALSIAANQPGVSRSEGLRTFANALATGSSEGLSPTLQDAHKVALFDFLKVYAAIANQELDEFSNIFNGSENSSAQKRLFDLGSCGLDLRRNGGKLLAAGSGNDAQNLKAINQFFASKPDSQAIQQRFGVDEAAARSLKNGQPYQSKNQFTKHNSQGKPESIGYALWATFEKNSG